MHVDELNPKEAPTPAINFHVWFFFCPRDAREYSILHKNLEWKCCLRLK